MYVAHCECLWDESVTQHALSQVVIYYFSFLCCYSIMLSQAIEHIQHIEAWRAKMKRGRHSIEPLSDMLSASSVKRLKEENEKVRPKCGF